MPDDTQTQALTLSTEDGVELEAQSALPADVKAVAVLAHPHPLYGGSMHAGVIDELFWALPQHGIATVRFNFRGVGASGGTHDKGGAERHDVAAALDHAISMAPDVPAVIAAWSFGADVSSTVAHDGLAGWFLIAAPLAIVDPVDMVTAADPRPKHLCVPENDQYRTPDDARTITAEWPNTTISVVDGADHFLAGHGAAVIQRARDFALAPQ